MLDEVETFTTKTRFELKFNSIHFVKIELWMKEIWHVKALGIQNVKFQHAVLLGAKTIGYSYLFQPLQYLFKSHNIKNIKILRIVYDEVGEHLSMMLSIK